MPLYVRLARERGGRVQSVETMIAEKYMHTIYVNWCENHHPFLHKAGFASFEQRKNNLNFCLVYLLYYYQPPNTRPPPTPHSIEIYIYFYSATVFCFQYKGTLSQYKQTMPNNGKTQWYILRYYSIGMSTFMW